MNRFKFILVLLFILISFGNIYAQRGRTYGIPILEELPKVAIDTVDTADPETKIILYANNTWEYLRPILDSQNDPQVYKEHWNTTHIFAYNGVSRNSHPEIINLELVDDIDEFAIPLKGRVHSKYGPRGSRNHNGVDLVLSMYEPIYASFSGKVRYSMYNTGGFGNMVILRHESGLETWYAHLSRRNIETNEYVKAGDVIGYGGSTGRSFGPHLHFEVRYCDQAIDPEFIFNFETGEIKFKNFVLEKRFMSIYSRASDQLNEGDEFGDSFAKQMAEDKIKSSEDVLAVLSNNVKHKVVSKGVYHTVRSGDMLGKLARKYGVSIKQICHLNKITTTSVIRPGQRLKIR